MDVYKIPLILTPQPEGGYTVTSSALPGLVTEGDTPQEVMENVRDALQAVLETYDDLAHSSYCQKLLVPFSSIPTTEPRWSVYGYFIVPPESSDDMTLS